MKKKQGAPSFDDFQKATGQVQQKNTGNRNAGLKQNLKSQEQYQQSKHSVDLTAEENERE